MNKDEVAATRDEGVVDEALRMLALCNTGDVEADHHNADMALCHLLTSLGFEEVVKAWDKVEKWYA